MFAVGAAAPPATPPGPSLPGLNRGRGSVAGGAVAPPADFRHLAGSGGVFVEGVRRGLGRGAAGGDRLREGAPHRVARVDFAADVADVGGRAGQVALDALDVALDVAV